MRVLLRAIRIRLAVWCVLATGLAFGVGALPLFGVLGFELALATAVFAAIAGLDLGAAIARAAARRPVTLERAGFVGRTTLVATLRAAGLAVAIAAIPGLVAAVRGIWVTTCDWSFGLLCYVAMPLATAALAGALGHAIGMLVGPRRFACALAAQVPVVVLAVAGVLRFYGAPPVFSYDAIIGYFPGNLYDENVQLGAALGWARLEQLCGVVAIVALVATRLDVPTLRFRLRAPRPVGRRLGAWTIAVVFGAAAIALYGAGGALGFAVDADDIAGELSGTIETPHFVIHYAHTKEIDEQIQLIAADHEFRYAQVVAQLGRAPEGKLTSFYFANRDQKGKWMGARDVEMAKPWRKEIYLDHRPFPHPSLRHEIAHAVASAFGDPIFGVAAKRVAGIPVMVNPGLVEGLAVAIDWPGGYDHPTPHESVRAMQATGMTVTIDDLLSLKFLSVSSARGYTTAGSFMKFLLDTYGAAAFRELYGTGGDFARAYAGKSLAQLESEWLAMIATIAVPPDAVEGSKERFRAGSVFSRPCPHANAARREEAGAMFGAGKRAAAVSLLREVCGDAPEEPRYRLELGDYLIGGTDAEHAEAVKLWQAVADGTDGATASVRAEALEKLARVAAVRGESPAPIIARASALGVDGAQKRQLAAETYALTTKGPAGVALRGYFFGLLPGFDDVMWAKLAIASEPDNGLPHYLLGLQRANLHDDAACAEELDTGLTLGVPGPLFVENGARRLALCAYQAHDRARVQKAIAWLGGLGIEADRLLALDWDQRLKFDAQR